MKYHIFANILGRVDFINHSSYQRWSVLIFSAQNYQRVIVWIEQKPIPRIKNDVEKNTFWRMFRGQPTPDTF